MSVSMCVSSSVIQLAQAGHPSVDPVLLGPVRGDLDGQHEVGGVASGGQSPPPGAGLIHRTHVHVFMLELGTLARPQPDDGQGVKEDLGEGLANVHVLAVPTRSLHEEAVNVGAVYRLLLDMALVFGHLRHTHTHTHGEQRKPLPLVSVLHTLLVRFSLRQTQSRCSQWGWCICERSSGRPL